MGKRVIHITEAEANGNFAKLLARVREGVQVIIEDHAQPIALVTPAEPPRRPISECIALLSEDSTATIDADFAKDVDAAVASHREPLTSPEWD